MTSEPAPTPLSTPTPPQVKVFHFLLRNIVPILFLVMCSVGFVYSEMQGLFFIRELLTRFYRNAYLVISLIIPVLAGLGLNFGIVLGAMAGQFGAIITVFYELEGFYGFAVAWLISIPLAILFGWLTGELFNRTKGKEMITGLILSFFANGIYLLICLLLVGSKLIPVSEDNSYLLLPNGIGLVNTIDLDNWQYAIDKLWMLDLDKVFPGWFGKPLFFKIPLSTLLLIVLLCVGVRLLFRTKLGQNLRAVGQDRHIAEVSGIKVDRTRIIAIIFSTVLAAWGQLLFLQNMGNLQTYGSHVQVGTFAVAALLVGGASVSRATIWQAIMGILLFHALFIVSPNAGKNIMEGNAQIGEYFRVFVTYGVIGVALALHAWQRKKR